MTNKKLWIALAVSLMGNGYLVMENREAEHRYVQQEDYKAQYLIALESERWAAINWAESEHALEITRNTFCSGARAAVSRLSVSGQGVDDWQTCGAGYLHAVAGSGAYAGVEETGNAGRAPKRRPVP